MKGKFYISEFVSVQTQQKVLENLVDRFKKRRKESKISQKELATKSGVSYGSIRRFEGSGEISLSSLLKLANALNCLQDFNKLFKNKIIKNLKDL